MNINATLIIQAANFFIAYILLRALFFKPVVAIIRQEQSHLDGLVTQLTEKRKAVIGLELSKQEQWRVAQQEFRLHFPDVMASDLYFFRQLTPEQSATIIDELSIKQVEKELVDDIIRKVDYARS